jgi:hypothetical protein
MSRVERKPRRENRLLALPGEASKLQVYRSIPKNCESANKHRTVQNIEEIDVSPGNVPKAV